LRDYRRIAKNFEVNVLDETPSVGASEESPTSGSFTKLKLSTPTRHGDLLQYPSFRHIDLLWQRNLRQRESAAIEIGDTSLAKLRATARQHVLRLASTYSEQYGASSQPFDNDLIVMAGHQPSLFHPGVWYKNFVLSELGQRFNCTSLNLIVDNDICTVAAIRSPQGPATQPTLKLVPFDSPAHNIPFEERTIEDFEIFRSFGTRAAQSIRPFVEHPIAERLWPKVIEAQTALQNRERCRLGSSIAAGRHRWESEIGLQTLELPLSWIADSDSFAVFAMHVLANRARFREIHNSSLIEYRKLYKIRSHSHPVPELAIQDQWVETPFWVWQTDNPFRKRLFAKHIGASLALSNLEGWRIELENRNGHEALGELQAKGIKIRPRALMTTMYCRLVLSDLFVHGIGGAKYDQLTDRIAYRFFNLALPEFCAISATMQLPTGVWPVSPQDVVEAKQRLRQLEFHAERFIDTEKYPAALSLIADKRQLILKSVPKNQAKAHRHAIVNLDLGLQSFVETQKTELQYQLHEMSDRLQANRILGSREYSFCLFPDDLIDSLRNMARIPDQVGCD
jgi:hypothetical protein